MLFGGGSLDDIHESFDSDGSGGSSPSDSGPDEETSDDEGQGIEVPIDAAVAENEIEGDFHRLVQDIRQRNDPSLAKDWDINIRDEEQAFKDDLRAASGVGKRRKGKSRGYGPTLSQQVRSMIGDGNQAFVDNDLPEAIRIMQEVIRVEPRAASAWSVLAQCYEDMQQKDRALQLRIMAAHLNHDAEEWDRLARESRNLGFYQQALYCYRKIYSLDPSNVDALWDRATLAKEIGELRIARQSFLSILKRFPHDLTVLAEIRPILVELGDLNTCTALFQSAFDYHQHCFPSGSGPISGPPETGTTSAIVPGGGFSLLNLLVLADLYNTLGEYDNAVQVIKTGSRWLQGRGDQIYWDQLEDDREFDPEGFNRATPVAENTINDPVVLTNIGSSTSASVPAAAANNAGGTLGTVEMRSGYFPLDVNARHRLAIARIKMGDLNEGIKHANIVLQEDVLDYAVLFIEIADAYYERGLWAEAKPVYEVLGTDASTSSVYILFQTASCLRMLDELKDAAEIYEHVRLADPTNNDAKMKLAEIYEIMNEPRKALDLVYQVIDSRKRRLKDSSQDGVSSTANASTSLFVEKNIKSSSSRSNNQNRLTQAQLKELESEKEKEVLSSYNRVKEIWDGMIKEREAGTKKLEIGIEAAKKLMEHQQGNGAAPEGPVEREWMLEAEKLVDTFRETRNLFTAARHNPFRGMFPKRRSRKSKDPSDLEADEDRMASRLQLDLQVERSPQKFYKPDGVEIFRGISFKDWLLMIIQYCFILTKRDQYELADEVLRHMLMSNAYMIPEFQVSIRLALISCAIETHHYSVVVEQCRKLISSNQFNNELYRLLLASLSSGLRPTDSFITSTLQKFFFREMKLSDVAVKDSGLLKWNVALKRWAPILPSTLSSGGRKDRDRDRDKDKDKDGEDEIGGEDSDGGGGGTGENDIASLINRPALPTKDNPLTVAIYGQMCIAAKSYQSAIFYLLHAYDYCPEDPMIALSLAIASVGRAMQRQSDNRHHLIAQGMAFLSKYRSIRSVDPFRLSEVEFNFGRMFQQLGLHSLAVSHYERVLRLAETQKTENRLKQTTVSRSVI
ncbi:hypothetical protein J3R30DRAFT_3462311 [Lentinula aciculospora]|uniref:TPR-like protein n=1 Tax=Lentinula aciculospora TaxID=153920 RepID=A0A9W9DQD4_9AGAR|nr:hypothetical protein J3R30DRAFT_3462311 [Lentinula aciculospora]